MPSTADSPRTAGVIMLRRKTRSRTPMRMIPVDQRLSWRPDPSATMQAAALPCVLALMMALLYRHDDIIDQNRLYAHYMIGIERSL